MGSWCLSGPPATTPAVPRRCNGADPRRRCTHRSCARRPTAADSRCVSQKALGKAARTAATHARPGTTRVSEHPREDHLTRECTETLPTRSRAATRLQEPDTRPTPRRRTHPRHRQGLPTPNPPQEGHQTTTNRLKIKVRACWQGFQVGARSSGSAVEAAAEQFRW